MNMFDNTIITYVNQFAQRWWLMDTLFAFSSGNHLLKGGVLVSLLWWLWFKKDVIHANNREHLIATFIGCIIAVAFAKLLEFTLPFRNRPFHEVSLNFRLPHGVLATELDGLSSFPSDHAALFFALSIGILFLSKKIGLFAVLYTTVLISLPRIYLGYHYPSDIIAGAVIGSVMALLCNVYLIERGFLRAIVRWSYSESGLFYPLFFLATYQVADLFDSSREIIGASIKLCQIIITSLVDV